MTLSCREPFLLSPACKDYLWGGERLKSEFNKTADMTPMAESWECSAHPNGESVVASGEFSGQTLSALLFMHPEILGSHASRIQDGRFPVLLKLIDARDRLSIQVHPDDSYARENEQGQFGKTECWYVLDAEPGAWLICGFAHNMDRETFETRVRESLNNPEDEKSSELIEKYFQKVYVKKDDVFFIPAGTVHAIGRGIMIAEIQENSDLTYRIFDYNRRDKAGNLRELHLDKALEVMKMTAEAEHKQPMRIRRFYKGYAIENLARCKYFDLRRMVLNGNASICATNNSFRVLTCVEGSCKVTWAAGTMIINQKDGHNVMNSDETNVCADYLEIQKGDTLFIPANSVEIKLSGRGVFIDASC